ncbi:peptide chain release factor N(5)-glutamine methyltransferase [Qipengyuania marisflavi]|uniref:Release factor glutamine methyltransferase n=1 Tax=Qipengyuania marisflavi TaxID=2486356 RepID=A0A5S3P731_9SPHN|nr:peptide chain release factor N(5)-glutamine methyltransferase [Qipengyuania marisflavi]
MTIGEEIRAAAGRLAATSDTARLDAELLMAHTLGASRSELLLRHMRGDPPAGFAALVERRAGHEPIAHITGHQEFYGLDLEVTPDTLIPRGDSETLVEAAREYFADRTPARVLDMGTGTGALLLAALSLFETAQGVGTDASAAALEVAGRNAARLGFAARADLLLRDWSMAGWAADLGQFDLVLCNPPYVEDAATLDPSVRAHEPASALFSGPEGLDDYRILLPQLRALMTRGGAAILEIGHEQADPVGALARQSGFAAQLRRDLAGRPRALLLT